MYGEWLISGNCPLTPAGNIRRPSEVLLGVTFHQNASSRGLTSAVSNDMNGINDDVLWEEDHVENSSSSDGSIDSD
jgi:hypothetical protein